MALTLDQMRRGLLPNIMDDAEKERRAATDPNRLANLGLLGRAVAPREGLLNLPQGGSVLQPPQAGLLPQPSIDQTLTRLQQPSVAQPQEPAVPQPQLAQPSIQQQPQPVREAQPVAEGSPFSVDSARDFVGAAGSVFEGVDVPDDAREQLAEEALRTIREPTAGTPNVGIAGRFLNLQSVPGIDNLSQKEVDRLAQRGLFTVGMAILGRGDVPFTTALARGLFAAREEATQTAGQLMDERSARETFAQIASLVKWDPESSHEDQMAALKAAAVVAGRSGNEGAIDLVNDLTTRIEKAHEAGLDRQHEENLQSARDAAALERTGVQAAVQERGQDITARGQDLSLQAVRERIAADRQQAEADRQAELERLQSEGVKLTEAQQKAFVNSGRMDRANEVLEQFGETLTSAGATVAGLEESFSGIPVVGGLLAPIAGRAAQERRGMVEGRQEAHQAGEEFIDAVLRQTTGAAATESERQSARDQYLPQPGDSPEVIAQKAQARAAFINDVRTTLPPAARNLSGGSAEQSLLADMERRLQGGESSRKVNAEIMRATNGRVRSIDQLRALRSLE